MFRALGAQGGPRSPLDRGRLLCCCCCCSCRYCASGPAIGRLWKEVETLCLSCHPLAMHFVVFSRLLVKPCPSPTCYRCCCRVSFLSFSLLPVFMSWNLGRTARMGAKGRVTSLLAKRDLVLAAAIEQASTHSPLFVGHTELLFVFRGIRSATVDSVVFVYSVSIQIDPGILVMIHSSSYNIHSPNAFAPG